MIHRWGHPSGGMVAEYEVDITRDGILYSVRVDSSNITIGRIPGSSYNLSVKAISVCGSKSKPLAITGLITGLQIINCSHGSFDICFFFAYLQVVEQLKFPPIYQEFFL